MTDAAPRLDQMLCFALYSANGAMNRAYKPALDALGLTYPQYVTLVALWERDGRTVGQLGEALFLESNTLTPLLKRMEAAGLVRRQRDPEDERQVRVFLTDDGRAMQARAADVPTRMLKALGCDAEAIAALATEVTAARDRVVGAKAA
ncbi:MarR family transcriptional regulator [Methylopila jiangsuensis]|uniref:MarR family transcriptional regulator n=1 Tax=Methylopila jiangsuensis TaxID=586230 RepID=A0A9W6JKK6_9HYPH|nr:MarR family transcriptional regulator [Methylopila jiangsuensis]MDR6286420.1 DNA-binding MarR family transcriptional regulator [Methylopila jiangsuensis]GLK77243.1 MarR family transcriptional regulator [Methylopila jiangsuensis]